MWYNFGCVAAVFARILYSWFTFARVIINYALIEIWLWLFTNGLLVFQLNLFICFRSASISIRLFHHLLQCNRSSPLTNWPNSPKKPLQTKWWTLWWNYLTWWLIQFKPQFIEEICPLKDSAAGAFIVRYHTFSSRVYVMNWMEGVIFPLPSRCVQKCTKTIIAD